MKAEFPRALKVTAIEPYRLRIRWSTGEILDVDVEDKIKGIKALAHILEPEVFSRARSGAHGASVEWEDSEFGADNVYAWTREQMGDASHEMFFDWMRRNNLSLSAAAEALGMSRRMVTYYRTGIKPIPKHVWLACLGWELTRNIPARNGPHKEKPEIEALR
jgi:hypothetical protein